jgi:hypothetical protein
VLKISAQSVMRDWKMPRTWLLAELARWSELVPASRANREERRPCGVWLKANLTVRSIAQTLVAAEIALRCLHRQYRPALKLVVAADSLQLAARMPRKRIMRLEDTMD